MKRSRSSSLSSNSNSNSNVRTSQVHTKDWCFSDNCKRVQKYMRAGNTGATSRRNNAYSTKLAGKLETYLANTALHVPYAPVADKNATRIEKMNAATILYRGLYATRTIARDVAQRERFVDKGFMAWTPDRADAEGFMWGAVRSSYWRTPKPHGIHGPVLLRLKVGDIHFEEPNRARWLWFGSYHRRNAAKRYVNGGHSQVLLPPGMLRVDAIAASPQFPNVKILDVSYFSVAS
jgi:hypothetical protein